MLRRRIMPEFVKPETAAEVLLFRSSLVEGSLHPLSVDLVWTWASLE